MDIFEDNGKGLIIMTPWNKGVKGKQVAWNKGLKMLSRPMSEEQKQRIRATMTGRIYSEERRAAMRKPRKPLTEEHKQKLSNALKAYLGQLDDEQFLHRMQKTWTASPKQEEIDVALSPRISNKLSIALNLKCQYEN
jgi:hypothetical protein